MSSLTQETRPTVVLVLQGGGALGAYQVGAYRALHDADLEPDWVAGISIGSVNAWIIAGNDRARRTERLRQFWHDISRPDGWTPQLGAALSQAFPLPETAWHQAFNLASGWEAVVCGQPHFFERRALNPFFAPIGTPEATSFYDTAPLRQALAAAVEPGLVRAAPVRLSLGATDVATGEIAFFHNFATPQHPKTDIGVAHVMASSSLPPAFPATAIGGRVYWDGGCVANTPLDAVVADEPEGRTVVFLIDLWSLHGRVPQTMFDVLWRQKEIAYAARNHRAIWAAAAALELRRMRAGGADAGATSPARRMDIVHVVYRPGADHIPNSDAEFSRESVAEREQAGYDDLSTALRQGPWARADHHPGARVVVHKVVQGDVVESRPGVQPS